MKTKLSACAAVLFLVSTLISLPGCYKDTFDFDRMKEDMITWEPDIAFPVVFSVLNAEDIISLSDSTNIYNYGADNFITLIYRKRIFSQTVNDFFQWPVNQSQSTNMNLNAVQIAQFTTSGSVSTTANATITFGITGPGGSQLDKVKFQNGTMRIAFTSNFEHSGMLEVSMPELRLNGTPFLQTYPIEYQNGVVAVNVNIPLAGYEMDLDNGSGPNTIPIMYTLTLNQGTGSTPTPVNQVQIDHSFENMTMSFADGNFGNFMLEIPPADVDIDVIESEHEGAIYFEDPRLRIRVTNTIGAEMDVTINQLYAAGDPGQVNLNTASLIPSGQFTIPPAPMLGDSISLEYYFTKDNSNIKDIVNQQYDKIHHDFDAEVNPNGPAYNFASLNSAVEVVADIELPFWGYADHFRIIDTVEVPFDEASDFADNIERALLRVSAKSHFPVDGLLKLYFADSLYNVLDSVLTDGEYVIESGVVQETSPFDGSTFKVVAPTITNNDIPLDTARINSLFASRYLLLAADMTTTNNAGHNIKLFSDDFIEIRIGLRVKLKASPSDIDDL